MGVLHRAIFPLIKKTQRNTCYTSGVISSGKGTLISLHDIIEVQKLKNSITRNGLKMQDCAGSKGTVPLSDLFRIIVY